ncbi:hypothetical protein ACFQU2_13775 [Siccirubricoccus deserti]|nr:hypothetical protein [Siccirubricoccus deserti]
MIDNLNIHGVTDVPLVALARPRWKIVFQPKDVTNRWQDRLDLR